MCDHVLIDYLGVDQEAYTQQGQVAWPEKKLHSLTLDMTAFIRSGYTSKYEVPSGWCLILTELHCLPTIIAVHVEYGF